MAKPTLLPDPTCLHLKLLDGTSTIITAVVIATSEEAACPLCHRCSTRIHSHSVRTVADLPWMGCAVHLELHVRRFFCPNQQCARQIFTERLPTVVAAYARRTARLTDVFTLIGFALGGEAGKRLVSGMGLATSPDTLLRLIHSAPDEPYATPRVLGVDDFSFRRGRKFGTILLDLEQRLPIDLLPDREASTLAKWLHDHPGVEMISRDRSGAYAEGARLGAPEAQQVADRFHLKVNLSQALERFFHQERTALVEAMHDPTATASTSSQLPAPTPSQKGWTKKREQESLRQHQNFVDLYHRVHEFHAEKLGITQIARQLNTSRDTVYRFLKKEHPPERKQPRSWQKEHQVLGPYQDCLIARWNEGVRNGVALHREIQHLGYTGSYATVVRFLGQFRMQDKHFKELSPTSEPPLVVKPKRPPTPLQVARWMTLAQEQRLPWQNDYISRLSQAHPVIGETSELVQDFALMMRERQGERLETWIKQVKEQGIDELSRFAQGLERDFDAVKAGLTLPWSQGPVEGHVHRLKLLKRQAYGRASFQTLRKRVLQCT